MCFDIFHESGKKYLTANALTQFKTKLLYAFCTVLRKMFVLIGQNQFLHCQSDPDSDIHQRWIPDSVCIPAVTKDDDMIFAVKFRHNLPDHGGCQFQFRFFFSGCFCDILIRGRIRPERKYYVTKIICFFQERNRFVNCSDPGASFYVLGQTG